MPQPDFHATKIKLQTSDFGISTKKKGAFILVQASYLSLLKTEVMSHTN